MTNITLPNEADKLFALQGGEIINLSGVIYTARDEAHLKLIELINENKELPVDLKGQTIYYAGPCPAHGGMPSNSCGPTTSARMDKLTEPMLKLGVTAFIGKGKRDEEILKEIKKHKATYLLAIGGAGALYGKCIKKSECVAFPELGCEAIYRFTIENFPVIKYTEER